MGEGAITFPTTHYTIVTFLTFRDIDTETSFTSRRATSTNFLRRSNMATKVTLRRREYESGKVALYLDFYPPVRNPKTMQMSRREYLGIYLTKKPTTKEERRINEEKLRIAEGIRAMRELACL